MAACTFTRHQLTQIRASSCPRGHVTDQILNNHSEGEYATACVAGQTCDSTGHGLPNLTLYARFLAVISATWPAAISLEDAASSLRTRQPKLKDRMEKIVIRDCSVGCRPPMSAMRRPNCMILCAGQPSREISGK